MTDRPERPNLRREVVRAAETASVPLDDFERALILGQIAGLLAAHPKVGGRVAFKGGAIMNLIDGSPRLSRDLDGAMVTGRRITEAIVREALSTPEAGKIVKRIERFTMLGKKGLRFPVIACHPLSGIDEITVTLSIHWDAPLILKAEPETVAINGRGITFLVVARLERLAEKIRAFVDRGLDRDAFDLYHFTMKGLSAADVTHLPALIEQKLREDDQLPADADLHALFDGHIARLAKTFGQAGGLVLIRDRPDWKTVEPHVRSFRRFIPRAKPV
jgi:Domain of unknown function (DUF1814).